MKSIRSLVSSSTKNQSTHHRHSLIEHSLDNSAIVVIKKEAFKSMHGSLESSIESIDVDGPKDKLRFN